jgi:hypothetical protein
MSETPASRTPTTSFLPAKFEISNDKSACVRESGAKRLRIPPEERRYRKVPRMEPYLVRRDALLPT